MGAGITRVGDRACRCSGSVGCPRAAPAQSSREAPAPRLTSQVAPHHLFHPAAATETPRAGAPRRAATTMMGNKGSGGPFAPLVVVTRNIVGEKDFNKLRGKAISLHSQGRSRGLGDETRRPLQHSTPCAADLARASPRLFATRATRRTRCCMNACPVCKCMPDGMRHMQIAQASYASFHHFPTFHVQ
eukprot:351806-Chlamydomonas_euryale.AAC.5